jgi:copper homeostasis protein
MKHLLEIAAFNIESALIAGQAGADRVELCRDQAAGGLTPATATIIRAKQELTCPFFVMIRPRPGGFVYDEATLAIMQEELISAKEHGADGFVFGIVKKDGTVDEAACNTLIAAAGELPCTFHRAFDAIDNKPEALETLIACGFKRLLTSGGTGNAADYGTSLQRLVRQAGGRIVIMPGGGVRLNNIAAIRAQTGATEYHSAALQENTSLADAALISAMKALLSQPLF